MKNIARLHCDETAILGARGYFAASSGNNVTDEIIKQHSESQGEHTPRISKTISGDGTVGDFQSPVKATDF